MIGETLKELEKVVTGNPHLSEEDRGGLNQLLMKLKEELSVIEKAHGAEPVAPDKKTIEDETTSQSVDRLNSTIEKIEATHPELAQTVNEFCTRLSSLGI